MTTRVCFYEAFQEEAEALKARLPPDLDAAFTWKTIQEAGDDRPPAGVISIRTQSVVPPAWSESLQAILSRSTGYDHLAAYRAGVPRSPQLGYLPLYCNRAVAEQAMTLWMALLRRLPRQMSQFRSFERDGLTGSECHGKTLVVTGVGNVGHEVVAIGRGLGMTVFGVDPVRRWTDVQYLSYPEAASRADVLVAAMNLSAANRGFFDRDRLGRIKAGAVFVNIARGELVDAAALLRLLETGHLAGVGVDVYEDEPALAVALREGREPPGTSTAAILALGRRDDVILTPHNAFNTAESVARKAEQSVRQMLHFAREGRFLWPVP